MNKKFVYQVGNNKKVKHTITISWGHLRWRPTKKPAFLVDITEQHSLTATAMFSSPMSTVHQPGALHHRLSGWLTVHSNTRQWLTAKYRSMIGRQT